MNLLLLEESEASERRVVLTGRRAEHITKVLRAEPGATLRAGVIGCGLTDALVTQVRGATVELELGPLRPTPAPNLSVVLAVPRPKAVSRVVQAASSFGLRHLYLINAWRVEKSYFSSPRLGPERLMLDALLGAEQGAQCHVPAIEVIPSFRRYVEDVDRATFSESGTVRLALHPHASSRLTDFVQGAPFSPLVLALGPEGGFIEPELASLTSAGYHLAALGTGPLRTEVALAAALGQLVGFRPQSQN